MSRLHRINELILHELSDLLHTRYREQSVGITFMEVDVAPDLRAAHVYYSVLGGEAARLKAAKFIDEIKDDLRTRAFKKVILKYTPALTFHFDDSHVRGNRTLAILDELEAKGEFKDQPKEPAEEES